MKVISKFIRILFVLCAVFIVAACSHDNLKSMSDDEKYVRLLNEYNYAEIYKLGMKSTCDKAIATKKSFNELGQLCFKDLTKIPNELLDQISLPYLKRHVQPQSLDELIQFYSQSKIKEISKRIRINSQGVTDDEYAYFDRVEQHASEQFQDFYLDDNMRLDLTNFSLRYLDEHP